MLFRERAERTPHQNIAGLQFLCLGKKALSDRRRRTDHKDPQVTQDIPTDGAAACKRPEKVGIELKGFGDMIQILEHNRLAEEAEHMVQAGSAIARACSSVSATKTGRSTIVFSGPAGCPAAPRAAAR